MKRVFALLLVISIVFSLTGCLARQDPPFFGINRGDTSESVKQRLGTPDEFDDNGLQNFNYYYTYIEFLDMTGFLNIHFKMSMVYTLTFETNIANMSDFDRAVEYYTEKNGEPIQYKLDYSDYYYESACAIWRLENGNLLSIEYHSAGIYEKPALRVKIYQ